MIAHSTFQTRIWWKGSRQTQPRLQCCWQRNWPGSISSTVFSHCQIPFHIALGCWVALIRRFKHPWRIKLPLSPPGLKPARPPHPQNSAWLNKVYLHIHTAWTSLVQNPKCRPFWDGRNSAIQNLNRNCKYYFGDAMLSKELYKKGLSIHWIQMAWIKLPLTFALTAITMRQSCSTCFSFAVWLGYYFFGKFMTIPLQSGG